MQESSHLQIATVFIPAHSIRTKDPDKFSKKSLLVVEKAVRIFNQITTHYILVHDSSATLINIDIFHMVYNIMMEEITITVIKCTCERCGGTWTILKGAKPPGTCRVQTCRSPYWNRPISRSKVSRISKSVRAGTYHPKK